jgi:hypothetical protein
MTYYDILGVPLNATAEQIKQAYRLQVRFFHPDLFEGSPAVAEIKTKQLNEAYGVLGNPELRSQYDRILRMNTIPPVKQQPRPAATRNPEREAEEQRKKQEQERQKRKEQRKQKWFAAVIILEALVLIACLIYYKGLGTEPETVQSKQQAPQYTETKHTLSPKLKPVSGTILSGEECFDGSTITISASNGENCVVSLRNIKGQERVTFFVRAGDTVTVGVPEEHLFVYFASGEVWYGYGNGKMFGEDTIYFKDDELLDFTDGYAWEYTLTPVSNGNFSETPSNENEFFK